MAVKRWVNLRPQYVDGNGNPLSGGRLFFYVAGTSTKQNTFTDSTGATPNSNPVVLNASGEPSTEIWLTVGATYKVGLAIAGVDDPPASFLWTEDTISPINDVTVSQQAQWQTFAGTPTFVSGTSFTVLGDQRQIFDNGRRVQTTNTGGTVYSNVSIAPTFDGTRTTVTLTNDSGALDAGLSAVFYGILSAINSSIPPHAGNIPAVQDQTDATKDVVFTAGSLPTGTRRSIDLGLAENICNGRLTLTTALPITTADVLAAITVFFTPFQGNKIATFNGSVWNVAAFTEKSVAVPATTVTPFDIFIVDGTLALETVNWTNDTTRATALVQQDGILVKSGQTTRRYLGTGRTTGVSGQCEDSNAKRFLWNYYNRALRKMLVTEATLSWNYTTATFRQANAAAANQLDFVVGIQESPVKANVLAAAGNSGAGATMAVGIGVDSTTVNSADVYPLNTISTNPTVITAQYTGFPGIGRHFLAWLETSQASGTTTFYSNNAGVLAQSKAGIAGELLG